MKKQQGHAGIIILVIVLVVALLGALGYIFYTHFLNKSKTAQVATTQTATTKAAANEQCATEEQVCFNLPTGWTFDDQTYVAPDGSGTSDQATFKNASGTQVGELSGLTGLGGTCGDEDDSQMSSYTIVKNTPTTIIAVAQAGDSFLDTHVNAVSAVVHDINNGYYPIVYLSDLNINTVGTTNHTCLINQIAGFTGKNTDFSIEVTNDAGYAASGAHTIAYYTSADQAQQQLSTADLTAFYGLIASAHYN